MSANKQTKNVSKIQFKNSFIFRFHFQKTFPFNSWENQIYSAIESQMCKKARKTRKTRWKVETELFPRYFCVVFQFILDLFFFYEFPIKAPRWEFSFRNLQFNFACAERTRWIANRRKSRDPKWNLNWDYYRLLDLA